MHNVIICHHERGGKGRKEGVGKRRGGRREEGEGRRREKGEGRRRGREEKGGRREGSYLAVEVVGQQDVPGSQVSVYKALFGKVAHPGCNILGKLDEENGQRLW